MKILHTADWQAGLALGFLPEETRIRLRSERFETIRAIGTLAKEEQVDAVLVAGDVLDDLQVGLLTLQMLDDALATFAPIPVLLLPGNHDAAAPHAGLNLLRSQDHVQVLTSPEPVKVGDGVVYPCPLTQRMSTADPAAALPERDLVQEDGIPRVALAHGGTLNFAGEGHNVIDVQRVLDQLGFDYLALGDYHGLRQEDSQGRAYYPGTPEPTRFQEKAPGNVLIVDIPGPGKLPTVRPVSVARFTWQQKWTTLHAPEDLDPLITSLQELPERARTLLELTLDGEISLACRAELDRRLDEEGARFAYLSVNDTRLVCVPDTQDFLTLQAEAFLQNTASILTEAGTDEDMGALRLLYRFASEEAQEGGA